MRVDGSSAARLGFVAALALWTISFARTPISADAMNSFLHLPDLIFHEAGHFVFAPLGRFMTVLGGSLLQFLIPVIAMIAFIRQEEPYSAAICGWWAGQNLVDVAPYIADARSLRLTLIGGRTGAEVDGHDWEFILNSLGISHYAHPLGYGTHAIGIVIMIAALAYAAMTVLRPAGLNTPLVKPAPPHGVRHNNAARSEAKRNSLAKPRSE